VATVDLPTIETLANTVKMAGMGGEIEVPSLIMAAQEATINFAGAFGIITEYGAVGTSRKLDLRADVIAYDPASGKNRYVEKRVVMGGFIKSHAHGSVEAAGAIEQSVVMTVNFYQTWLDGVEQIKWDPFAMIYTVKGQDLLAQTRKNLGM
jgi:P2 family phage contractile tail tube protein